MRVEHAKHGEVGGNTLAGLDRLADELVEVVEVVAHRLRVLELRCLDLQLLALGLQHLERGHGVGAARRQLVDHLVHGHWCVVGHRYLRRPRSASSNTSTRSCSTGEILPSLIAVATVVGSVRKIQTVAPVSTRTKAATTASRLG